MDQESKQEVKGAESVRGPRWHSAFAEERSRVRDSHDEITFSELWQIVVRRKAVFLGCFVAAVVLSVAYSLIAPARYEGVGRLTVDFDTSRALGAEALAQVTGVDAPTMLQTQVNVLETDALAWDVITRLRLDQRPEAAIRKFLVGPEECMTPAGQPISGVGPECRRRLIDEFHRRLHVQPISRTEIIEIRYRCRSRELAATVVNTLADLYAERSFQTKYQAAIRASTWLSGQLDEVKHDAETAAEKYIAYQKQTGIIGTDQDHNILIERLVAVNQQLVLAESERIVREARNRIAQEGDPEAIASVIPGSKLQVLHAEEVQLQTQYAQLDAKFGRNYPRLIQVKEQLDQATQATAAELTRTRQRVASEYESAKDSEALLRAEFEKQKQEAYNTNVAAIQIALLKRDVDASNELYEQLVRRLKEAGIIAGISANGVTMIDPATIPVKPVEPDTFRNVIFGMVIGSAIGLALCFMREGADTTLTTLKNVAEYCPLPVLGVVPRLSETGSRPKTGGKAAVPGVSKLTTLDDPESEGADAYRSLRTSLRLSNPGAPPKIILVTSSLPREGKTTTSVNTAVVFSQRNYRVLLVDADLRCGDLRRYLNNVSGKGGLSSVLAGEDPQQFYHPHPRVPNLTILPAGLRPPRPPDLLDSDRMRQLIARWREEFDQVILDAPPLIGLSDAVILSTMADTVMLVLRVGQCRRQDINRAVEKLKGVDAKVSGVVINDLNALSLGYYGEDSSLYSHYFNRPERGA